MKRFLGILTAIVLIALSLSGAAFADEVEIESSSSYSGFGALLSEMLYSDDTQEIVSAQSVSEFSLARLIFRTNGTEPEFTSAKPVRVISGPRNIYVAQFASASDAEACCNDLQAASYVKYVEPDCAMQISDIETRQEPDAEAEDYNGNSWGVSAMGAGYVNTLVDYYLPNASVKVGVIDSGISPHSFLGNKLITGGYDYIDGDNNPIDENGHGTHVAGTIVDMTQELKVYVKAYRTLNADGAGYTSASIAAIYQATIDGMDVINMSLGGTNYDQRGASQDAIDFANNNGVTVCIAAGNESSDTSTVNPGGIKNEGAIVVAAIDYDRSRCWFSNYGESVDVAAPGGSIYSCDFQGGFTTMSGTSMATPHVSGAAAIIKLCYPSFSPAEVERYMKLLCEDLGDPGWDKYYGCGLPILIDTMGKVSIDTYSNSMCVGDSMQFTASVWPKRVYPITWESSDEDVLTVDSNGVVTAVAPGTAQIAAVHKHTFYYVDVNVSVSGVPTAIQITGDTSVLAGGMLQLSILTTPADSDSDVIWTCSDSSFAVVSPTGLVLGIAPGTVTITATYKYDDLITNTIDITILPVPATGVTLNTTAASVIVGNTTTLTATVLPDNATDKSVIWTTSDAAIATVDANGVVTGVKEGKATVTATAKSNSTLTASCEVTVAPVPLVPVTALEITPDGLSLYTGDTSQLSVAITPADASDKTVTWTSSAAAVATVDANGLVTAVAPGTATITSTANTQTGVSDSITVTVTNRHIPVTSITVTPDSLSMLDNATSTLTAAVLPADASDKTVTWTSSDTSIVTVDNNGVVTAVAVGTAKITCAGNTETGVKCEITVTVTTSDLVPVTSVTLDKKKANIAKNATIKLTAKVEPANATYTALAWTSSDSSIATVSAEGVVTGLKSGSATITATARSGKSASCVVTVKGKLITKITLNKEKYTLNIKLGEELGKTYQLTATIKPSKADNKTLKWKSSDTKVATVDENGLVTSVGFGKCTITASAKDGSGLKAKCVVTVAAKKVSSITVTGKKNMKKGDKQQLTAAISPAKAYNQEVKWKSSDTKIATVDENGVVTAIKKGKVTITAISKDGTKVKGKFEITIKKAE